MIRHFVLSCLVFLLLAQTLPVMLAFSQLPDEETERRTEIISKTLRCVTCQNQTIHESNAPLAEDMRALVKKRIIAGDSDDEVRAYLSQRYGDYVLMTPPFQPNTWVLWLAPAALISLILIWWLSLRGRSPQIRPELQMNEQDKARVQAALNQEEASESS